MYIEIDDKSGFCFGVVKAITKAEESLAELGKVFSLGDIVHNRVEVQRLEKLGLETIAHSHFPELDGQTVLIRAHGEPPTTYALAAAHRIRLIDATCPVVARLQTLVKKAHEQMSGCNGQVVILGKRGHAEVVGLTGQVDGDAIVIETLDDKVRACAGGAGSRRGTGGMQTKLNAAELVAEDGIDMVLSNGNAPELLYDIIKGKAVGTRFLGKKGL